MSTSPPVSPQTHARYLDYRDRHTYFGKQTAILPMKDFVLFDDEHRALDAKGEDHRTDDEEARFAELSKVLLRD